MLAAPQKHIFEDGEGCTALWNSYFSECLQHEDTSYSSAEKINFATYRYKIGHLNSELVARAQHVLAASAFERFDTQSSPSWYFASALSEAFGDQLTTEHGYYRFSNKHLWLAWDVIDEIAVPIAQALGQPWRVLAVRGWKTGAKATAFGPNDWHVDGMPKNILKCMVYFTPIGGEQGGVHFRVSETEGLSIQGPAGTWLLFENSTIVHRGVAPTVSGFYREAYEITLAPSASFDLRPRDTGKNARHPRYPWSRA